MSYKVLSPVSAESIGEDKCLKLENKEISSSQDEVTQDDSSDDDNPYFITISGESLSTESVSGDSPLSHNTIRLGKESLKSVIKDVRARFMCKLEDDYKSCDAKSSPLGVNLAMRYFKNDLARAKELLASSSLPEAKYLLMKVYFDEENYFKACYYSQFLTFARCTCPAPQKSGKISKNCLASYKREKCPADRDIPNFGCLKHQSETMMELM